MTWSSHTPGGEYFAWVPWCCLTLFKDLPGSELQPVVAEMKRTLDHDSRVAPPAAPVAAPPQTTAPFSETANLMERLNWDGTDEMKEAAAFAVRKLAWDTDNHKSIVCAIPHLVSLLCSGPDGVSEAAADAIYPLARNKDNHIALAGTVVPLVSLLCKGTDRAKESAMDALRYLISDVDLKRSIGETCAIKSLVALLHIGGNAGVTEAAAILLALLSWACRTNQIEIAEAGAIDPLVALLHTNEPLSAVEALLCLAYNNHKNAVAVGRHRSVIPLLVAMHRGGVDNDTKDAAAVLLDLLASAGFTDAMQR